MRRLRAHILLLLCLTTLACETPVRVSSDYDITVDFDGLSTYDWVPESDVKPSRDPVLDNSLLQGRVRRAVDYELHERGYRRPRFGPPDFWVTYHVGLDRKLDVRTINNYPGYYRGSRNWGGYSETQIREYEEGTLLIDVVAPDSGTLIWRGTAQTEVRPQPTPEDHTALIDRVVGAIMAKFPPSPRN